MPKEQLLLRAHLGQTIYVHGYAFIVADIWDAPSCNTGAEGRRVVLFRGFCTADSRNDDIRDTGYNGGVYSLGWLVGRSDIDCRRLGLE